MYCYDVYIIIMKYKFNVVQDFTYVFLKKDTGDLTVLIAELDLFKYFKLKISKSIHFKQAAR